MQRVLIQYRLTPYILEHNKFNQQILLWKSPANFCKNWSLSIPSTSSSSSSASKSCCGTGHRERPSESKWISRLYDTNYVQYVICMMPNTSTYTQKFYASYIELLVGFLLLWGHKSQLTRTVLLNEHQDGVCKNKVLYIRIYTIFFHNSSLPHVLKLLSV